MIRRTLLQAGLATPFLIRPSLADLGGNDRVRVQMAYLHYEENGREERLDRFYLRHGDNAYRLNINHGYEAVDEANPGRDAYAGAYLRGSIKVGSVYRWGDDLHATADQIPQARAAPILFQLRHEGMRYSLNDRITLRRYNRASSLPSTSQLRQSRAAGDLRLNREANVFVAPMEYRITVGFRY